MIGIIITLATVAVLCFIGAMLCFAALWAANRQMPRTDMERQLWKSNGIISRAGEGRRRSSSMIRTLSGSRRGFFFSEESR